MQWGSVGQCEGSEWHWRIFGGPTMLYGAFKFPSMPFTARLRAGFLPDGPGRCPAVSHLSSRPADVSTVWVKKIPPPEFFWHFFWNGWEFLVQILRAYSMFLSTLEYKFLFSYLQLWRSYAILSMTTIIYSKCPPSVETHAGWSHLIWHNFVTVRDNRIKICTLA